MSNLQSLPSLLLSLYTLLLTITLAFSSDKEALLHFKSSLRDPTGILSDWNPNDNNPCSWTGISCDTNSGQVDQVTAIQLTRNQFCSISINSGNNPSYPNPSLLPCLEENGSKLYGKLSSSIGELTHLRVLALGFNSFAGRVPKEIGNLKSLRFLDLGFNHFQGELPETIGNCGELEEVSFAGNQLNGTIPVFFAKFSRLRLLSLSFNRFDGVVLDEFGENCGFLEHLHLAGNLISGPIPRNLGNCGRLRSLVLSSNVLEDGIPKEAGNLKMLEVLDLSRNYLSRPIPAELGNCKNLKVLVLKNVDGPFVIGNDSGEFNYFGGEIPDSIVSLPELRLLWIPDGNLEGTFPLDWGSCLHLEMLNLGQNYFSGEIPTLLSKCNRLAYLDLSSNNLTGRLVNEFPVSSMVVFNVSRNSLVGDIPRFNKNGSGVLPIAWLHMNLPDVYCSFFYSGAVKRASSIFSLPSNHVILHDFSKNQFTGPLLPMSIHPGRLTGQFSYGLFLSGNDLDGNMSNFSFELCPHLHGLVIDFSMNRIWGELPSEVGRHCKCIDFLDLSGNGLEGPIPSSFAYLDSLVKLNLSSNKLHGPLPSYFNQMKHLRYISLSHNNFTGNIPQELAQVISLEVLELSENSLSGEIPSAFTDLGHLRILQLDHNNLSGKIPSNFSSTSSLSEFDVSFNNLSGPVPQNLTWIRCEDLKGNPNLQPCQTNPSAWEQLHSGNVSQHEPDPPPKTVSVKSGLTPIEMASVTSCSIIISVLVALVFLLLCMRKCVPKSVSRQGSRKKEVVTCNSIGVQLTYDNVVRATGVFNIQNCIGCGGFGATYKAEIAPGVIVAVKRLSIGRFQGLQQFAAEIRTLGRVQHSNLVTLIGYHVSESEMFLIYNYLPGGNLERFIQDRAKRNIDWSMLHKIALDIARALAYLHDDCTPRVLHRDIKPSNILLDNNFNAYLSDFGLARLLGTSETHATTDVAGTFGYVAPEYAMTCRVSDKADVYSYGVVLLELISDKKALDPTFSCYGNGFNIVAWACMLLRQGRARDFFTAGLWDVGPHDDLVETLHLAVMCTVESLSTRPSMKQVAQRLKRIQPPTC